MVTGMPFPPPGDHGPMSFDERGLPPMPPDMLHGESVYSTELKVASRPPLILARYS